LNIFSRFSTAGTLYFHRLWSPRSCCNRCG